MRNLYIKKSHSTLLIFFSVPFIFCFTTRIFAIDKQIAFSLMIGVLLFFLFVNHLWNFSKNQKLFLFSILFSIVICLSLPFWLPVQAQKKGLSTIKPLFSYSHAKGNPLAFEAWWNFFVSEVVRTNSIIHTLDPQGRLPHILKPNASVNFYQGKIQVNSIGYRGDEFDPDKKTPYRILVIGESTTFGQTIFSNSRPWPEGLEALIEKKLSCNKPIQVINGGVNGYVLKDGIERLERDANWLKPNLILSYFGYNGVNDIGISQYWLKRLYRNPDPTALNEYSGRSKFVFLQLKNSLIKMKYKLFSFFEDLFYFNNNIVLDDKVIMKEVLQGEYYRQYLNLIDRSKSIGCPIVLLHFNMAVNRNSPIEAVRFFEKPFPGISSTIHIIHYHNLMLRELSRAHPHVIYADISNNLEGLYDSNLFLDVVHFTRAGDDRMAENIFQKIESLLLNDQSLQCSRR